MRDTGGICWAGYFAIQDNTEDEHVVDYLGNYPNARVVLYYGDDRTLERLTDLTQKKGQANRYTFISALG